MFQGTGSDVGKSLLVAGLARAYTRRGLKVRPFKPQNMSNNAAVAADGGEIGRAQALQARAACVPPSVHMNPVLLKPQSMVGSQVVVQGKVFATAKAAEYMAMKARLLPCVLESYEKLKAEADLVLVEGAGSASEINLRRYDIANMGFARAADVPVVVVGDIDRGGVIASLVGTKAVLDPEDEKLVVGFIINKFRGDPSLFIPGKEAIVEKTGWPALGFVPYFSEARNLAGRGRAGARSRDAAACGREAEDRGADPAADRQLRRSRSASGGAHGRPGARASRHGAAGRRRPGDPAGLEDDHRRAQCPAQHGLRHRHRRACAARRHA